MPEPEPAHLLESLHRQVGAPGATLLGLGSMLGTGVFVSIGTAAGVAGPAVVLAICLAAVVAACNALSSAQLAARHPVSGGTYEYGYRLLSPWLGFTAGWMFLCAKTASAATAALGFAGYALAALDHSTPNWLVPVAVSVVAALTLVALAGMRQSSRVNAAIVCATLFSLVVFCVAVMPAALSAASENLFPVFQSATGRSQGPVGGVLHASALMFVAFTGYGRIATLGEEVREPERTIPRAILLTLLITTALYLAVGLVSVAAMGSPALYQATLSQAAPLEQAARRFAVPGIDRIVAVGAMAAMLGVLLNLVLGLSRVMLAMARRSDLPRGLARLNRSGTAPTAAVVLTGALVGGMALVGNVKTTWAFSAFTVLVYYAITNAAALRLAPQQRLYSPAYAWCGLVACLLLGFFVDPAVWRAGLALMAAGLVWHHFRRRLARRPAHAAEPPPAV